MKPRANLLVGLDFSSFSEEVLAYAFDALAADSRSKLTIAHVCYPDGPHVLFHGPNLPVSAPLEHVYQATVAYLDDAMARGQREVRPGRVTVCVQIGTSVADELRAIAMAVQADSIIVGTHGRRGFRRLFLGSVAEELVRVAPCSVTVVRPVVDPRDVHHLPPHCSACQNLSRHTGRSTGCARHSLGEGRRALGFLASTSRDPAEQELRP